MSKLRLLAGLALLCLLTSCTNYDDHDHPEITRGDALFDHHCAKCHGRDGTGDWVQQIPANILTQRGTNGVIEYITTNVNAEREMPVFSAMPHSEASLIVRHLFELRQKYNEAPSNKRKPDKLMFEP